MRFLTATKIFDGTKFLPQGTVLILDENNLLLNIVNESELSAKTIERYEGILCPGFVNTHCHLELSHMLGAIPENTGLVEFAKGIITKRNSFSEEQINSAIEIWDKKMYGNGIVAVGDICNGLSTFAVKAQSKIVYHSFIELIGLNPAFADQILNKGKELSAAAEKLNLKYSFAPHAPYSVSPDLMQKISGYNSSHASTSSIHNQESREENKFFLGEKSRINDLYQFLNIDISYFRPTKSNSLPAYLPALLESKKLLLVHNTFSSASDIDFAEDIHKGLYWCLCPNANLYIENTLPDVNLIREKRLKICLGTDSLASNHNLSIVDEINVLLNNTTDLEPETVLQWATKGGAEALGIENQFGSFEKGKRPGINLVKQEKRSLIFSQKLA